MLKKIFLFLVLFFVNIFTIFASIQDDENIFNFLNNLLEDFSVNSEESSFLLDFQRPSYVENIGKNKSIFVCDISKDECKINFNLTDNHGKSLSKYKYYCKNNFGFLNGQENKCNPNSIIFKKENNLINFKIYDKKNDNLLWEKFILVLNDKKILEKNSNYNIDGEIFLSDFQKFLDSKEEFDKNFKGIFEIKNNLSSSGIINNSDRLNIKTKDDNKNNLIIDKQDLNDNNNNSENLGNLEKQDFDNNNSENLDNLEKQDFDARILVQGRQANYKERVENKIICHGVDKCNINFIGERISGNIEKYIWNFGNGIIIEKQNPSGIWLEKGNYTINLEIFDYFGNKKVKKFFVVVEGKKYIKNNSKNILEQINSVDKKLINNEKMIDNNVEIEESKEISEFKDEEKEKKQIIIDKNFIKSLKIVGILPNNKGKDDFEYFILQNTGKKTINLKGLIIDDIVGKGSKPHKIYKDIFLKSKEKRKFYKSETHITFGNNFDEINIFAYKQKIDSLSRNFSVGNDVFITKNNIDYLTIKDFTKKIKKTNRKILNSKFIKSNFDTQKILDNKIFEIGFIQKKSIKKVNIFDKKFKNILISEEKKFRNNILNKTKKILFFDKFSENFKNNLKKNTKIKNNFLLKYSLKKNTKNKQEKDNFKNTKKINFSQSIKKQKKSLKIYGKTLPNSKIILNFAGKKYEIFSNKKGKYSLKIKKLSIGSFEIKSKVVLKNNLVYYSGKDFLIGKIKKVFLDKKYVNSVYVINNKISKKSKKNNNLKKKKSNFKNYNYTKIGLHNLYKKNIDINRKNIPIFLNLFLGILIILFGFLFYMKNKKNNLYNFLQRNNFYILKILK